MNHPLSNDSSRPARKHVLSFYAELEPAAREQLDRQLQALDLDLLDAADARRHRQLPTGRPWLRRSTPPPAIRLDDRRWRRSLRRLLPRRAGEEAPARRPRGGHVWSRADKERRLGFAHPKGMFPIGPVSGHSLFQILIEKVVATARRYHTSVPLYVMTSPATHEETVEYLAANDRFGLPAEDLRVFCQGTMPAVDAATGKLILAAKDSLALAPDGHGGMLEALRKSGALQHARDRNIAMFSYGQIDNPLAATLPSRTARLPPAGRIRDDHPGDSEARSAGTSRATWSWSTARCTSSSTVTCPTSSHGSAIRTVRCSSGPAVSPCTCSHGIPGADRPASRRPAVSSGAEEGLLPRCTGCRTDAGPAERDQVRTIHFRLASRGPAMRLSWREIRPKCSRRSRTPKAPPRTRPPPRDVR